MDPSISDRESIYIPCCNPSSDHKFHSINIVLQNALQLWVMFNLRQISISRLFLPWYMQLFLGASTYIYINANCCQRIPYIFRSSFIHYCYWTECSGQIDWPNWIILELNAMVPTGSRCLVEHENIERASMLSEGLWEFIWSTPTHETTNASMILWTIQLSNYVVSTTLMFQTDECRSGRKLIF